MDTELTDLLASLYGARSFEEAARSSLGALLQRARTTLERSPFEESGRIARAMVHLRPADGYRRLLVVDAAQAQAEPDSSALLPSASAWRWVVEHRRPVAVDVNLGTVDVGATGERAGELPRQTHGAVTQDSRVRLLARQATHLLLIPLRAPGGAIDGMLAIEADCRPAMGKRFIWHDVAPPAQAIADVSAPFLVALPTERRDPTAPDPFLPVIGASMSSIVEMLRIFAEQEETVLLSGPTGSGKSRLARWCHQRSRRAGRPFETLDLATVPEDLQMAELFGWKRGAFTGAARDTAGVITRAQDGTLFIDEIDKLSLRAQAGLLRVLEERRYRPLGEGDSDRAADVRFLIGTNANLRDLVKDGRFREDLFYRINVLPVRVPPLGDRRDEIRDWATYMLQRRHEARSPSGTASISDEAVVRLQSHPWPGNLRQLDNIVRRAYTLSLLEHENGRDIVLSASHVDHAFALEGSESYMPLLDLLSLAAEAFVTEAQRLGGEGARFRLDHAEALRGLILAAAARRLGSKEDAFRLFGKSTTVSNRNHSKVLRAELSRVTALREALGLAPDPRLAALLTNDS